MIGQYSIDVGVPPVTLATVTSDPSLTKDRIISPTDLSCLLIRFFIDFPDEQ